MKGVLVRAGLVALAVIGGMTAGPVQPREQRAPSKSAVFSQRQPEPHDAGGARSHSPVFIHDGEDDPEGPGKPKGQRESEGGTHPVHGATCGHEDFTSVPEPATYALLGVGLIAVALLRKRAA